jgi:hypothetical protein
MRSGGGASADNRAYAVVAGGPDTAGREAWLWDLSVEKFLGDQQDDCLGCLEVANTNGGDGLRLRYDERQLAAQLAPVTILPERLVALERSEKELVVIVSQSGRVQEGTRVLDPGDVLVVEGEDPAEVDLVTVGAGPAVLSIGRLHRHDGRSLRWMP